MAFLKESDKKVIQEKFASLDQIVTLSCFTQDFECQYCKENRELMEEVAALSDKIQLKIYDFQKDEDIAKQYNIDKIPATVVESGQNYGVRFFGIPAGYEFTSLLEAVTHVSLGKADISKKNLEKLSTLAGDVHIQVFVTPTWPYCPQAVVTAHKMAIANKRIVADMVEATEFVHLSQKYNVRAVPRIVINEAIQFDGALPEDQFVLKVMESTD